MIPYKYCPFCREELEARRVPPDEGPMRRVCSACGYVQWGNSKPSSSGILVREDGKILLAKRAREPFKDYWDIPGGFLDAGEHPEAGVIREFREETGLEIEVVSLIGVYMDTYGPEPSEDTLNFYYECRTVSGTMSAEDDVSELGWFDPTELPGELAFENGKAAFRDWTARRGIG
jgi:8-oxo-dGTP diphosphatase